jgi:hypothetical protein
LTLLIQTENSAFADDGTPLAILYESKALSPPVPTSNTWGGPRNSASRVSKHIRPLKALEFVEAALKAHSVGLPFNRHLTVHWGKAGFDDREAAMATGRLIKLVRDWIQKKGDRTAYAWMREDGPDKGTHSHILLHVPDGLKLAFTGRWFKLVTGWKGRLPRHAVKSVCIGGTARAGFSGSDWYLANLAYVVGYLLKGSDEPTGDALGLDEDSGGGSIIGKRMSICSSLKGG